MSTRQTSERWEDAEYRARLAAWGEWKANHNEQTATPVELLTAERVIRNVIQRDTAGVKLWGHDKVEVDYMDMFESIPTKLTDHAGRPWRLCGCGMKGPLGSGGPWRLAATYEYMGATT